MLQYLAESFSKKGNVCRQRNIYCQSTYYFYSYLLCQDCYNLNVG